MGLQPFQNLRESRIENSQREMHVLMGLSRWLSFLQELTPPETRLAGSIRLIPVREFFPVAEMQPSPVLARDILRTDFTRQTIYPERVDTTQRLFTTRLQLSGNHVGNNGGSACGRVREHGVVCPRGRFAHRLEQGGAPESRSMARQQGASPSFTPSSPTSSVFGSTPGFWPTARSSCACSSLPAWLTGADTLVLYEALGHASLP